MPFRTVIPRKRDQAPRDSASAGMTDSSRFRSSILNCNVEAKCRYLLGQRISAHFRILLCRFAQQRRG